MSDKIKFFSGKEIPLEMHKVIIVQKLNLISQDERLKAINEAGNNTFLLRNDQCFLDMLTDSGVNAMSNMQQAAMMQADDSYAGSATFYRLEKAIQEMFGMKFFLPTHQGRACESIITKCFTPSGSTVIMNHHFTTTRAHILDKGGKVEEFLLLDGFNPSGNNPFKGNMDVDRLDKALSTRKDVFWVRMEAGTNLIGGQPFSLQNLSDTSEVCKKYNILLVVDASLWADNLYFIKTREKKFKDLTLHEITLKMASCADIIYFSARKLGCARGGAICTNNEELADKMRPLILLYEGFATYGGMSVREMEAIAVGLYETLDIDMISQGPQFIKFMTDEFQKLAIPVITPSGGLGCHLNAMDFVDHIPREQYRAASLASALYLVSGVRGMERGTTSEERNSDGTDHLANMELLRLAVPRRVFTMSQLSFVVDRVHWLFENRKMIGGLEFCYEPKVMRFFLGRLKSTSHWQENLVSKFKADFGDSN